MAISEKQREVLRTDLPRITILEGTISSGKTFIGNHKAMEHIANRYDNQGLIFFVGKTLGTLEKNVLLPLEKAYRGMFRYSIGQKAAYLNGVRIELEGCNDVRAEEKIRGSTAEFIYGDEVTLWNKAFMTRCMGSLRVPGATFLGTTNPDRPDNFVKKDFLDRADELDLLDIFFDMQDNPSLTPEYIEQVNKEYTGVFHDRFIKGLWVNPQGLVYPNAENCFVPTENRRYTEYQISGDYGIHNPTAFGLFGKCGNIWYMVKEYRHSGKETNQPKTDDEYYTELDKFAGDLKVRRIIIDPSASSFITLIRRKGKFTVIPAINDVLDGIRHTASAMANGILKFNDCCTHAKEEFKIYSWDEKSISEDRPIKESDHMCDLIRYFCFTNKIALPTRKSLFPD